LQALLITDGSVIPERNQISFANTSKELINRFCHLINKVYNYKIKTIGKGKGTKKTLYLVQLKSKAICSDLMSDMNYNTTKSDISIPKTWFDFHPSKIADILRNLFDADGGCSLRISFRKDRKCFEIKRTVFLSCNNSNLRKDYRKLLQKIGIKTGESSDKVTITNKVSIGKFKELVNFSRNVHIGYDSKHWQGLEKRKLLDIILKSYFIDRGFIQTLASKRKIYNYLASSR